MTCREELECLIDYVDGALAPERRRDCEQHLGRCSLCRKYLNQYRETIVTIRACDSTPSTELPERLVQSILSRA